MKFEDLNVRKLSKELFNDLYKSFPKNFHDNFFREQILKAGLSISNNIAEGAERVSYKEFSRFLKISKGSCGEVRSMLYLSLENNFIDEDKFKDLIDKASYINVMLFKLIDKVQKNN